MPFDKARNRRRLMIGTDGESNTGKTEFILSCPGPGIVLCLDRGFDSVYDNPKPPLARRDDFAMKVVPVPMSGTKTQPDYVKYWTDFRSEFYKALDNQDAVTVAIDGDSDSWELQRLAEFGKLTQVPPLMYPAVNMSRRALIARAWDSCKVIVATNKVKNEYREVLDDQGNPVLDDKRKPIKEKTGQKERQGFSDQDFLWQLQLTHLYKPPAAITMGPLKGKMKPQQWGIRITKCKANAELAGQELWNEKCNFSGLVQLVYPHVPLSSWFNEGTQ